MLNPLLSRPADRIIFGGAYNLTDGQNVIISTSDGTTTHNVLLERDGFIGLGSGSYSGWNVGNPTLRISENGDVSVASKIFLFGNEGGPPNCSALITRVSNVNEWNKFDLYPNGANNYYFGTILQSATAGNSRAPLFLGARYLTFNTGSSDVEAVRISERGHLLIGTTDDRSNTYGGNDVKLQVNGSAIITENTTDTLTVPGTIIQGAHQDTQLGNGLVFNEYGSRARMITTKGITYQSNNSGDQHVFANEIGIQNTGAVVVVDPGGDPNMPQNQPCFKVNGQEQPFVITVKGRTGIGTLTPSAQLHTTGSVRFEGLANDNSLSRIVVCDANGNLSFRDYSSFGLNKTLSSDLAVNGTVSAQKMLISQTGRWPDYVFSKQYHLPSLTEVENFINQNNHLPGIPSAAEVEKKGIDVAGNQAALLKKIEELTLYVIEQEKQLQDQKAEISELKKQNSELLELKKQVAELMAIIKGK